MTRTTALLLAAIPVCLACCNRRAPAQQEAPADASASAAPLAAPSGSTTAMASAAASARPPKVLTPAETKAYQAALGKGRQATVKKDWPAACAAFDQALTILPDDPRAQAERGYARMLSDDLDGASKDFEAAQGHSSDHRLEAQIWFNLGLVAEKRGKAEAARTAFARSFALNPMAVAQAKLEGKSRCIVGADRAAQPAKNYPSWRAVWDGLASKWGDPPPSNEVEARNALHVDTCPTACVGSTPVDARFHLFFPRKDGSVDVHEKIGEGGYYRCGGPPGIEIIDGSNPVHVVVANSLIETGASCFLEDGQEVCRLNCAGPLNWYRYDLFFDPVSHQRLLSLSQTGGASQDKVNEITETTRAPKVDAEAVEFDGAGCGHTRIPFKAP